MNGNTVKCRICWEVKERAISVSVATKWAKGSLKSIKDVILLCVPWMSITEDSCLCKPCLWQLKFTYDFIERCLKTENILNAENNIEKVGLEDIIGNSLKKGNKIQIIFENPVVSPTGATEDTDVVDFDEPMVKNNDSIANFQFTTRKTEGIAPSEHDYCIKKGTQIDVDVRNSKNNDSNQSNSMTEDKQHNNEESNVPEYERENEFTTNDDPSDDSDYFNDSTDQNVSDPCDASIFHNVLTKTKKKLRSKTVLSKTKPVVDETKDPQQLKLEDELKQLLDIAAVEVRFITAHCDMTAQQRDDLVRDGINVLNMSKDPTKKKRTIYLSRDLFKGCYKCCKCDILFISRVDYQDHLHLHRRGKIKTPGDPIYTCNICSETFTFDKDFRGHSKAYHGLSSPHQCTKCNKRFRTFKLLDTHNKLFKDLDKCVYKCVRCDKEFPTKYSFNQHEADVKDAPCCNYKKCRICFKKFTKEEFKIHCTEVHSNYLCQECGKSFTSSVNLTAHIKYVHKAVKCMCHECGKILNHPKCLEHHIQTVHGEKNHICDKCPRQFTCQAYLQKHMRTHLDIAQRKTSTTARIWRCNHCGKSYTKKHYLILHEQMFHLGVSKFSCPICNEGFYRSDYLKRHIKAHDKYIKNTCTICKKSFGTEWRLDSHLFVGHDENGRSLESGTKKKPPGLPSTKNRIIRGKGKVQFKYVCKICGKIMANKQTLDIHYRAHLSIRRNKCDLCGVVFQGALALKKHQKLHEDPNFQFSCNICHAYKSSSAELENHMRQVHKNKKYKCKLCDAKFGRKHLLHSHETIYHTEEVHKRQAIYNILQQDRIIVPATDTNSIVRSKYGRLEVDIDTFYDRFVTNKEDASVDAAAASVPKVTTVIGDYFGNFAGNQTPSHEPANLANERRRDEDERACRVLVEENRTNELYISYNDES